MTEGLELGTEYRYPGMDRSEKVEGKSISPSASPFIKENIMGQMKWRLMDMESEACGMTKEEFLKRYPDGEDTWERMNNPDYDKIPDEPIIPIPEEKIG